MEPQLYWHFVSSTTFTWFSLDFSGNPKLPPPAVLRKTSPFRTCQKLERLQRQFEHGAGGAEPDAPYTQFYPSMDGDTVDGRTPAVERFFNPLFIGFQPSNAGILPSTGQKWGFLPTNHGSMKQSVYPSIHLSTYLPFGNPIYGSYAESNAGKLAWLCHIAVA
jgi:hypothetical protein